MASFHLLGKVDLFMLWVQLYIISSAIYGAASLSRQDPILSVLDAVSRSTDEKNLKTFSFSKLGIVYFLKKFIYNARLVNFCVMSDTDFASLP